VQRGFRVRPLGPGRRRRPVPGRPKHTELTAVPVTVSRHASVCPSESSLRPAAAAAVAWECSDSESESRRRLLRRAVTAQTPSQAVPCGTASLVKQPLAGGLRQGPARGALIQYLAAAAAAFRSGSGSPQACLLELHSGRWRRPPNIDPGEQR
jgi:hypothetical protein